jgi:molecular chaperone HtpG
MNTDTYTFKAEINELMNMIIHNFYSNKDIFLRELISNASDAINKLKYNSLTNNQLLGDNSNFDIRISSNKENKTITIEDTGIGMGKDDLINNLGTIAKSGTKDFIKKLAEKSSSNNLIGQFGVGFYSGFLVADRVSVKTRLAGTDETFLWDSNANGQFTIRQIDNEPNFSRGTSITLFIKDDEEAYLEDFKIKEIIKKHSMYITYPIYISKLEKVKSDTANNNTTTEDNESVDEDIKSVDKVQDTTVQDVTVQDVTVQDTTVQDVTVQDVTVQDTTVQDVTVHDAVQDVTVQDVTVQDVTDQDVVQDAVQDVKEPETYKEVWEKVNSEPIWTKSADEISEKEHEEFYKSLSHDWDTYSAYKLFKVEGNYDFTGLFYIPKRAPFDLFDRKKNKSSIKLYVKKVLISDDCPELYPDWMGFVSGIVDSQDLPLNASRELLQQSKIIKQINKTLVSKTLDMLTSLAEDKEKYTDFYKNFDKNIKLGICEDTQQATRDKLVNLLRFKTSKGEFVSLEEYKNRMKEGQSGIYYITGETLGLVENSPFADKLKRLNYEIIYMTDAIDEYTTQHVPSYSDIKLLNVAKDDLKLDPLDKEHEEKYKSLCDKLQKIMGDRVEKVTVSNKIETQPAIITNPMGMSANMERIMKAQALATNNTNPMQNAMLSKRHLEINPNHPVIEKINSKFEQEENVSDETNSLVNLLYDCALLAGGYQLSDINNYLTNVYNLM